MSKYKSITKIRLGVTQGIEAATLIADATLNIVSGIVHIPSDLMLVINDKIDKVDETKVEENPLDTSIMDKVTKEVEDFFQNLHKDVPNEPEMA